MKSKQIKTDLSQLREDLINKMIELGQSKSMEISALSQPIISYFMTGKRSWDYEKLVKIAERFGL